jgi:hypothetical protein
LGSVAAQLACACGNDDANEAADDDGNQEMQRHLKATTITAIGTATATATIAFAAVIGLPATANADPGSFQSMSGNIFCDLEISGATCEIADYTYALRPSPCEHSAWGDRFTLEQGSAPVMNCHNDTIRPSYSSTGPNPDVPVLDFGQTQSAGSFTCDSQPSGVTCTDNTTGHFFRVSRESYQLD